MVDINILNRNVGERDPEEQSTSPPVIGQRRQGTAISDDHQHL